jgi:iron complex transport system permease protein
MNSLRTSSILRKLHSPHVLPAAGVLLLLAAIAANLCFGAVALSPARLIADLSGTGDGSALQIIRHVRFPRTVATLLAGSALAVSGMVIQSVLGNPLASPGIIGVNSGAGFMATLACAVFPGQMALVAPAAFVGALLAVLLVYGIGRITGASRMTIILAGVAISSILSAGIDTVVTLVPDALMGSAMFRIGGVAGVTLSSVFPQGGVMLAAMAAVFFLRSEIDILTLGGETAQSLGLPVGFYRFLLLGLSALLAGSAVSFAGLIGFVGLLVPHIARRIVGTQSKELVPCCMLLGAAFLTLCDLLARTLFSPFEIPVGLVLSLLGGPFFLWLLICQKGRGSA